MYITYTNEGSFVNLHNTTEDITRQYIEITDEQVLSVFKAISEKKVIKVIDGVLTISENMNLKRSEIVLERDVILESVLPYVNSSWYREDNIEGLNAEIESEIRELYQRLCDMPTHFDNSEDKQNWSYKWVDEYTSGKNTNSYQIKRLSYIKWKK